MEILIKIFLTFAIVYGIYMILCATLSLIGVRELKRAGIDVSAEKIEIPAEVESLEYLVRCAIFAFAFEKTEIVILIDDTREDASEISYIAEMICMSHKNVTCKRI